MRIAQNLKGISRLIVMLLLLISFLLGATLSYLWTMGFYAPNEYHIPGQTNVTIENARFYPENATFFNITVLNPSYSPSDAVIEQIRTVTSDGLVRSVDSTLPALPLALSPGQSQGIKSFWNWGNYTGQTVNVDVVIAEGSGSTVKVNTPFMNLTVSDIIFEPSISATRFNVTVASMGSSVSVNVSKIIVNGAQIAAVTPTLPYQLNPGASATFTLERNWADSQNKTVSVVVQTEQGYAAYATKTAPEVKLNVSSVVFFNTTATSFYFNVTIQNSMVSPATFNINSITVYVEGQNITIKDGDVDPALPQTLQANSTLLLMCTWDWSSFEGKNATVTVYTVQGFKTSIETTVQRTP